MSAGKPPRAPLPAWLKKRLPVGETSAQVRALLSRLNLSTVCSSAHCPNIHECFSRGTATFMILGERCTRNCGFCAVSPGEPPPPRADEPDAVAQACEAMNLSHVVVTSVTRDDLPDGGAGHFAATIRAIRAKLPAAVIEVLTPDFLGSTAAIDAVLAARPDIFNHNLETVPRLYPAVRPQAIYPRSLEVLKYAADRGKLCTKSGIMLGLGETRDEVLAVLADLRAAGVSILTVGQYLAPSAKHVKVQRFVEPAEFDDWARTAREMGFAAVAAGPFVRSSYRAEQIFQSRTQ